MRKARRHDEIAAVDIGAHAASRLSDRSHGHVLAVFARGFHVLFDEGLVLTVGHASLGSGPSNLLVAAGDLDALGDTAPGDAVAMARHGVLRVAREAKPVLNDRSRTVTVEIDWTKAPCYRTPPFPPAPDMATLRAGRARLAALDGAPAEGFGWQLRSAAPSAAVETVEGIASPNRLRRAFHNATRVAVKALDDWLVDVLRDGRCGRRAREITGHASGAREAWTDLPAPPDTRVPVDASLVRAPFVLVPPVVRSLLGAGPGLTPSGDDLLAGVLLALHRQRRADATDALWRTLAPALDERTHPFSAAQLALAANGEHATPIGMLLDAVFDVRPSGTEARAALALRERLDAIGMTSGWDLAAGIAMVIDARLAAGDRSTTGLPSRPRPYRAIRC